MRMSDLQDKKIININDGKEIGTIIDITINNDGKIINFITEKTKFITFFNSNNDSIINWDQINKIGEDVILVSVDTNTKL